MQCARTVWLARVCVCVIATSAPVDAAVRMMNEHWHEFEFKRTSKNMSTKTMDSQSCLLKCNHKRGRWEAGTSESTTLSIKASFMILTTSEWRGLWTASDPMSLLRTKEWERSIEEQCWTDEYNSGNEISAATASLFCFCLFHCAIDKMQMKMLCRGSSSCVCSRTMNFWIWIPHRTLLTM